MQEFVSLSIFDREKFERIQPLTYEVTCVGKVTLSDKEKSVLRMHPTFSILETLKEDTMEFEIELSNAKWRMTINKELQDQEDEERQDLQDAPQPTPPTQEQADQAEEEDARSRLTFDPLTKVYNDRKRRVTDLDECSRVTLPKPLPTKHENLIEMRRSIHANIYNEHRRTKCKQDGEQTSNLTEEQQAGLKSLKKRIEEKEIVVLKTDKSTKLCVATMEEYIKMGQKHTKNDKQVYRREIQEIEKNINGHTFAWSKMWDTGGEHGHLGRVIDSKVSHSENVSIMYVVYKDHKKDPGESRPIVTGNSGHTRGLSNSVSNFLESIANAIANPFECISTEDMLSNTKKANKLIKEIIKEWQARRLPKLNCNTCNYKQEETRTCNDCMQTGPEEDGDNAQDKMETQYDCDHCGREWRDRMEEDCVECGPGIFWEDQEICLLGLDVVALFPSMSSETTGKIIRKHVLLSPIKIEGFDWRQGARYVLVNKRYTSDLACLWGILPFRRKDKGTAPGMKSKDINSKEGDIGKQWIFPKKPTDQQIREIQARCAEIATRFLFQNFCYKFQGNTYLQSKGGPIGARVTMAAARIVMSDWGEEWRKLIEAAGVKLPQLDGYVDDVRNRSTSLRFGTRWNDKERKFTWTREDMMEDKRMKYE